MTIIKYFETKEKAQEYIDKYLNEEDVKSLERVKHYTNVLGCEYTYKWELCFYGYTFEDLYPAQAIEL